MKPAFRSRPHRLAHAIALICAGAPLLGLPLALHAQNVDLGSLGNRGFRIEGIDTDDLSGRSVSGAGDVNGDGLADVIIGANRASPGGVLGAGESYVVFGSASVAPVSLSALGARGFRIDGIGLNDAAGIAVSGAGDVNGDGLADLIVGASRASPGGRTSAGETYVVFGKPDSTPIDLAALGAGGFRIEGIAMFDFSGFSVSGAGDVNGDGRADLVVGSAAATVNGFGSAGQSYVVFGKTSTTPVVLGALGTGGFRIDGFDANDQAGFSVSGAGDVNGDGLADVIVGANLAAPSGLGTAGEAYVVFGKPGIATVDLAALGSGGFRIQGASMGDQSARSVAGAGDVNGDGLADLIIGSPNADAGAGASHVVFGKTGTGTVQLAALGSGGFRIAGVAAADLSGHSVGGAGDVNGDGLADLIVGAYAADPGSGARTGESYVVFGKSTSTAVNLAALGTDGFRMQGAGAELRTGWSNSGAGDLNGDGLSDVIVGAYTADPQGNIDAGESYVVFGAGIPTATATARVRSRNGNAPRMAFGTSGDGSNTSTPDARAWIDFADGSDPIGTASTEILTLVRSAASHPAPGANVSWALQTTRQGWTSAELRLRYVDAELTTSYEHLLRIEFSATGVAPFTPLVSVSQPFDNTVSAIIDQAGFYYLGTSPGGIFSDGFE